MAFYIGGLDTMPITGGRFVNLSDGRFECDWHIWILSGNQFANHMQKTGPKSDIFHGFWSVFLMKFENQLNIFHGNLAVAATPKNPKEKSVLAVPPIGGREGAEPFHPPGLSQPGEH